MGRPRRPGVRVTVKVDDDVYKAVRELSDMTGIPLTRIVNRALRLYVEAHRHILERRDRSEFIKRFVRGG